jgi:hypothetical protein
VRLGIKEQGRVARSVQELSTAKHVPPVGAHGVRQYDGSETRSPRRKPAPDMATRSAGEGNRGSTRERVRGRADLAWHRRRQRAAERPGGSCGTADREQENENEPVSTHVSFVEPPGSLALHLRTRPPGRAE